MLRLAVAAGASDLHLCAGLPPHLRVSGELGPIADHPPLSAANLEASLHAALTSEQRRELDATGDLELGLTLNGFRTETGVGAPDVSAQPDREVRRFRASMFRHSGTLAAAIRLVPHRIPNLAALGLPSVAAELAERPSGLVLVTGPTGSGKSTTLASMVEAVNQGRAAHILTIE
ncbi:MAG: ATPase, T2SS/T4P/T4SS family, partial [Actinomycetota bacterium]